MLKRGAPTVVIAPTAFKGTLAPSAVAAAIARGIQRIWPEAKLLARPLSDGGTGLLDALAVLEQVSPEVLEVSGPLGTPVQAAYVRSGRTAIIESAEACGLHRVPQGREDPLVTTTRGVGELLGAAAGAGTAREAGTVGEAGMAGEAATAEKSGTAGKAGTATEAGLPGDTGQHTDHIVLGLGGSATIDAGTGMARALGWRFLDAAARPLGEGGGALVGLDRIEPPSGVGFPIPVTALWDVGNPLLGAAGAARVFGPQKGAGPEEVERLAAALERLATVVSRDLGVDVAELPGGGAAGGLGAGARVFLGATLTSGADWMIERAGLLEALREADLVVTGEGRYDEQSSMGKITGRVVTLTSDRPIPTLLVAGRVLGELPPHVRGLDGGGRRLTAVEVTELTESGCRALAAEHRL